MAGRELPLYGGVTRPEEDVMTAKKHQRMQMQKRGIPVEMKKAIAWSEHQTWWNGEPCKARIVHVIVGHSDRPTWWCASLEGTVREAVEIEYGDFPLAYIDNDAWDDHEAGEGWRKVTIGRGSPQYGHWSLPVKRVIE